MNSQLSLLSHNGDYCEISLCACRHRHCRRSSCGCCRCRRCRHFVRSVTAPLSVLPCLDSNISCCCLKIESTDYCFVASGQRELKQTKKNSQSLGKQKYIPTDYTVRWNARNQTNRIKIEGKSKEI